eukprot:1189625-Prorocentrum_minimum.AAC.2
MERVTLNYPSIFKSVPDCREVSLASLKSDQRSDSIDIHPPTDTWRTMDTLDSDLVTKPTKQCHEPKHAQQWETNIGVSESTANLYRALCS